MHMLMMMMVVLMMMVVVAVCGDARPMTRLCCSHVCCGVAVLRCGGATDAASLSLTNYSRGSSAPDLVYASGAVLCVPSSRTDASCVCKCTLVALRVASDHRYVSRSC
jgi:hypothetical protein